MKGFRAFAIWVLVVCGPVFAGCHKARVSSDHSRLGHYDVRATPDLDRSVVDTVVQMALDEPMVKAHPERYSWISVGPVAGKNGTIDVELHGYMDGYVVRLTNSATGWCVASTGRMTE